MSTIAELIAAIPPEPKILDVSVGEYITGKIARRDAQLRVAYEALKELLEAVETPMPVYESGIAAQNAWANRRAEAHRSAASVLAAITPSAHTAREAGNG